ncbi:MAG: beta-ketoacyl-[acyl-carrier-protein] synthase family protein [Desulfobacteraceae bacterium]|nr:MAG: beta-ketoacyl-[acyl-carrier-protein] synthase family protein [Desulfobacteraceae bacterium]
MAIMQAHTDRDRRVMITGVGVLTSIGLDKDRFWESIINGKSNISDIQDDSIKELKIRKGCVIQDFDIRQFTPKKESTGLSRGAKLSLAAAKSALEDSGLDLATVHPSRIGISIGTTLGESQAIEEVAAASVNGTANGPDRFEKIRRCSPVNLVASIKREYGIWGPTCLIPAACAAGNYAIGFGYDAIKSGTSDIIISGGVEPFSKILLIGFSRMKLIAPDMCQPFDRNRKGLLVGEGAGMLILEEYGHARKRNARIYGELLGYGLSCDAYHMAAPQPDAAEAALALQRALDRSRINPGDVQYISAHGTGTHSNDLVETRAIKKVFGSCAKKTPVSSIKSMIGHTMGAAGAIEAVLCAMVLQNQIIPPTINLHEPDPLCDLDYVPNEAREADINTVVSNSYGFFGNNASIVLSTKRI